MKTPAWMNPNKIRFVTIHCTGDRRGVHKTAAQISATDVAIWGQVSYHYVIELDGKVTQTLRHDQLGCHVGKHNTGNIGISYVGGLDTDGRIADTRTPEQRAALEALVRSLLSQHPAAQVKGHRDWSPDTNGNGKVDKFEWLKGCPCFEVSTWLEDIGL